MLVLNTNLLPTERGGRTGEHWPEVLTVHGTKTTKSQYSPVRLEQVWLVSSLLYGTRAMLVLNFPDFESKKNTQPIIPFFYGKKRKNKSERSDFLRDYLAI